jgi:hypothetical protein
MDEDLDLLNMFIEECLYYDTYLIHRRDILKNLKYLDEDTIDKVLRQIGLLEVYHILHDLSVGPDSNDYEDRLNYLRENIDFNILNSAEDTIMKYVTPSIFL